LFLLQEKGHDPHEDEQQQGIKSEQAKQDEQDGKFKVAHWLNLSARSLPGRASKAPAKILTRRLPRST
jgi:hypothetical protein